MRIRAWAGIGVGVVCLLFLAALGIAGTPEIVRATFFGTAEDDDIQGVCAAPDGTFYVAGNMGASLERVPGGAKPMRLGSTATDPKCGHGFVAHLSADGSNILGYVELAKGIAIMTTVRANDQGVYVSGYASEALEPLIEKPGGLIPKYPLVEEMRLVREGKMLGANGMYVQVEVKDANGNKTNRWEVAKHDPCDRPVGLGRRGAPFVLRFSSDLQTLTGGTYLEGWQTVWRKDRLASRAGFTEPLPPEYYWQATHMTLLKTNDVLVCHDGGYFRRVTDADRKHAGDNMYLLHHMGFYDVCDYFSRLSPDLSKHVFLQRIYTPRTDPAVNSRIRNYNWPVPHMSRPRTLNMRLDRDENVYICGWSASLTSKEPWWSPYIWKMSSSDGSLIKKIEETDPMSGGDNRMGGSVADRAIGAIALDGDELIHNSYSDGGWSGCIHFSGSIGRGDMKTGKGISGARVGPCMWAIGMAVATNHHVVVLGRGNGPMGGFSDDAWQKPDPKENPEAWLRLYDREMKMPFSTALRGLLPYEIAPLGTNRFVIVGQAALDTAPVKDALFGKPQGKADGYFLIMEWNPGANPPASPSATNSVVPAASVSVSPKAPSSSAGDPKTPAN